MEEKLRVVLDTNVLISATFWKGSSRKVLDACMKEKIRVVTSLGIIEEFIQTLARETKFKATEHDITRYRNKILEKSDMIFPKERIQIVKKDVTDNKVLECAVEGNANYVISRDNHLLDIKKYRGIKTITPERMIRILENLST